MRNRALFLTFTAAVFGIFMLGTTMDALAELPTSATCRYRVQSKSGKRLSGAVHRFSVNLGTTLGLGESCTITHNACGSVFIPASLAPNNDSRRCFDFDSFGTSSMGAGDSNITARSTSRVLAETNSGRGRQITYGADAVCTDGTNTTSFSCDPKAKKVSINGENGTSVERVVRQLAKKFRG
ncbi:MAG: hypothetical protein KDD70_14890 [Bdellovibrionales bacterium]|nr:hypothetical protein [Bdellovibrionales bacterium]